MPLRPSDVPQLPKTSETGSSSRPEVRTRDDAAFQQSILLPYGPQDARSILSRGPKIQQTKEKIGRRYNTTVGNETPRPPFAPNRSMSDPSGRLGTQYQVLKPGESRTREGVPAFPVHDDRKQISIRRQDSPSPLDSTPHPSYDLGSHVQIADGQSSQKRGQDLGKKAGSSEPIIVKLKKSITDLKSSLKRQTLPERSSTADNSKGLDQPASIGASPDPREEKILRKQQSFPRLRLKQSLSKFNTRFSEKRDVASEVPPIPRQDNHIGSTKFRAPLPDAFRNRGDASRLSPEESLQQITQTFQKLVKDYQERKNEIQSNPDQLFDPSDLIVRNQMLNKDGKSVNIGEDIELVKMILDENIVNNINESKVHAFTVPTSYTISKKGWDELQRVTGTREIQKMGNTFKDYTEGW